MNKSNILIIDDEAEIREVLSRVLSTEPSFALTFACNGEEALTEIKKQHFDIMITDLAMPKMNGFELLRRLKVMGKSIPTIVLTGHGDLSIATQLKNYGVSDFMNKPWDNDQLIITIQKLLHQKKMSAS